MSRLMRANAEEAAKGVGEKLIRYPYVLGGRSERKDCSSAGNGAGLHQA